MNDLVIVLTTISESGASELATALVQERLAACVNVTAPMHSTYRWQDQIETEAECQLVIKTTESRLSDLERRLAELHPYELPEFIVIRPDSAGAAYKEWVRAGTSTQTSGGA